MIEIDSKNINIINNKYLDDILKNVKLSNINSFTYGTNYIYYNDDSNNKRFEINPSVYVQGSLKQNLKMKFEITRGVTNLKLMEELTKLITEEFYLIVNKQLLMGSEYIYGLIEKNNFNYKMFNPNVLSDLIREKVNTFVNEGPELYSMSQSILVKIYDIVSNERDSVNLLSNFYNDNMLFINSFSFKTKLVFYLENDNINRFLLFSTDYFNEKETMIMKIYKENELRPEHNNKFIELLRYGIKTM